MAASVVGTATGLYIVVNQDLSHDAAHGDHHDDHHAQKHEPEAKEASAEEASAEDAGDNQEEENKDNSDDGPKHVAEDGTEDNSSKDVTHSESREKKAEGKKAEKKDRGEVDTGDEKDASPDKSDKVSVLIRTRTLNADYRQANPRKQAKSSNETSGKQEGISNDDTHHTSQISKQEEKSKKGEGVAESAKLKGTVSTDRPGVSTSLPIHIV